MKSVWLLQAALAVLIVTTSSGCSLSGDRAFGRAAADLGRARAGLTLERQPGECGKAVPHIRIREGDELRSILKRERAQLDVANRRIGGCFAFNEDVRAGLAGEVAE